MCIAVGIVLVDESGAGTTAEELAVTEGIQYAYSPAANDKVSVVEKSDMVRSNNISS